MGMLQIAIGLSLKIKIVVFAHVFYVFITQTCPCNILQYFTVVKMIIFR